MASIRKRTLPSGKTVWLVDYVDQSGRRRAKQFSTKRDADAWMVQARSEVQAGIHTHDRDSVTVEKAGELWITKCEAENLERTTLSSYRAHLRLHINPRIGGTKLSRLTAPAVAAFRDQLVADGRSAAMVKRVLGSLSSLVSEAQRKGLVAVNNVKVGGRSKRAKRDRSRIEMPTRDELKAMLAATTDKTRPLIMVALLCGLRASELRGLLWTDIDLRTGVMKIRRRVDRYNAFGPPKSEAGNRDIPMSPALLKVLKEWKLACPNGELGLVFPTGAGGVESHGNLLSRVFWPLQIAAGVAVLRDDKDENGEPIKVPDAKYSLHALRHAAAALWIEQGLNAKRVQYLMGHSSIQQTYDTYGYLLEARDQDQNAMDEIAFRLLN